MDDYKLNCRYKVCTYDGRALGYFPSHFGADIFLAELRRLGQSCCIEPIREQTDSELLMMLLSTPSDSRLFEVSPDDVKF